MKPLIIAHRACPHHAPENSLAGIRKAAELGADAVEVDVQRTLDGVPVLMHDRTLWRTAGIPLPAWAVPYRLLRRVRLRGTSEPVPTLAEAFEALSPGLKLAIEIKHGSATEATLAEVRRRGMADQVLIWSDSDATVRRAVREVPQVEVSLLRSARSPEGLRRFLDDARRFGARGVSVDWRSVSKELVWDAHRRGLVVYSLAPLVEKSLEHARAGVDGVITDWPDELRAALRASL